MSFEYEEVDGRKIRVRPREVNTEVDADGFFHRQKNRFTEGFGEGRNPIEAGRYHLVWAKLCHWSNRASIVRELLSMTVLIPAALQLPYRNIRPTREALNRIRGFLK